MKTVPNIKPISDLRNHTEVLKAALQFMAKLEEGEQSAREQGWLAAGEIKRQMIGTKLN